MKYFLENKNKIGKHIFFLILLYIVSRLNFIILFGSYFNIYILVAILIFVIYFSKAIRITYYDLTFGSLLAWMFFIYFYRKIFDVAVYDENNVNQFDLMINTIGNILVYYFIGRSFGDFGLINYSKKYLKYLILIYVVTLFQFLYYSFGNLYVDYDAISQKMSSGWVSHLDFGATLVLLCFLLIANLSRSALLIFIPTSVYLFFILGGRSALIIYMLTLYLIYVNFVVRNAVLIKAFLIGVPLSSVSWIFYMIFINDPSFVDRVYLFKQGFDYFYDQLLVGDPAKILSYGSNYGSYIHNILGAIQIFGVVMLIITLLLSFSIGIKLFFNNKHEYKDYAMFVRMLFVYSVISLILTKFISEWIFWFSLGLAVSYINTNYKINGFFLKITRF
jgi:hypothetical protein